MKEGKKIFIIPDAQVREGVPTDHLLAAGRYIVDKQPDIVVCLGDWWDLESLSIYDKPGTQRHEGRRYRRDVVVGNDAMRKLLAPLDEFNKNRTKVEKKKKYKPRMVFCMGNHEHRIERAINHDPAHLEGIISYDDLLLDGWEVFPYMERVKIEGILFSHCFANPFSLMKGNLGGTIDNKIQKIGSSFVMGHQQQIQYGVRNFGDGREAIGIVCGAFYQHHEEYLGRQGNDHFRGCIVLNDTQDGYGDLMVLSLKYLKRKYL